MANITFLSSCGDSTGDLSDFPFPSGTVAIDNTISHTGGTSIKCDGTTSAANIIAGKCLSDAGSRVSFWMRLSSAVGSAQDFIVFIGTTTGITLQITPTNTLQITGSLGTISATGTHAIPLNTWTRITISFTVTSSTVNAFKTYVNGVQDISITNINSGTGTASIQIGWRVNISSILWLDDIYADNGADLSDPGNMCVAAKFPVADSGSNGWSALGAAQSAGSHYLNVSEKPASDANGFTYALASSVEESYTIQGAAVGLTDVSAVTIVGYAAWVRASEATVGGTPQIINNGTAFPVTLTTTISSYFNYTTSPVYPSAARAVGMVSSGTAVVNTMTEAGVLIAFLPPASAVFLEPGGDATGDLSMYDSVPTPANTTVDSANAHTGTYAIKCVTASGATGYGGQKNAVLTDTGSRISFWIKFSSLPAQSPLLVKTSGGSPCWNITISLYGTLTLQDNTFTATTNQVAGPAAGMVVGTWYRVSLSYVVTSATVSTFKAYVNGVLSFTATNPVTIAVGSSSLCLGSWAGNYAGGTPIIWFDDVYVDNGSDLTDPGNISIAAVGPTADSGSNGGTAFGTARAAGSHFLNVSEIPKNDANGIRISLAAQTEESFTLGSAPLGTQVGYVGWLRAYQAANASASSTGTSTVTNVGSNFSTALASLTVASVTAAAGTAIFVAVTTNGNVTVTASDGSANVYTRHAKGVVATNNNTVLLSTPNTAGLSAATITISFGGVTTACVATVFTATNLLSSGGILTLDGVAASGGSSSSSAAMSLSVTTTQTNSLEIGAFGLAWSGDTLVAATGTAVVAAVSDGGSTSQIAKTAELLCVYRNLTASGASTISATDSTSTARQCSNVAVAFRVAAASAAVTPGTYQAVLNGALLALSLTATTATYIFYPASGQAIYPSAARGVGLTALGTLSDAVSLTEAGVLIAYIPSAVIALSPRMMAGFVVYAW